MRKKAKIPERLFTPLDDQERDLQKADMEGSFRPLPDQSSWKNGLRRAAQATLAKNRHISLRLTEKDLQTLKDKAGALGIPYQTLIGSILHQFAEGKIHISF